MSTTNHTAHSNGEALTSTLQNAPMSQLDQAIEDLRFADLTTVTLVSDVAATPTLSSKSGKGVYNLTIAAQADTSPNDDLIEVTGISVGDVVLLRADAGDTITVKHNSVSATIKIHCIGDADITLDEQNPTMFIYVETNVLSQVNVLSSASSANYDNYETNEVTDYTTSSISFTDIDATNLALTITTTGNPVLIGFAGAINNTLSYFVYLEVDIDGLPMAGDDGIFYSSVGGADTFNMSFVYLKVGLSAASHTFKLQWKVNSASAVATMYNGAGTASKDVHPQFWVMEI